MCNGEADIQKVLKYPEQHCRITSALCTPQLCYSALRGSVPLRLAIFDTSTVQYSTVPSTDNHPYYWNRLGLYNSNNSLAGSCREPYRDTHPYRYHTCLTVHCESPRRGMKYSCIALLKIPDRPPISLPFALRQCQPATERRSRTTNSRESWI
jgi:hypothetical protein